MEAETPPFRDVNKLERALIGEFPQAATWMIVRWRIFGFRRISRTLSGLLGPLIMVKKTLKERCQTGLDFFEFLNETNRVSITNKQQLKDIYNNEFRKRWAFHSRHPLWCECRKISNTCVICRVASDPNLGSVLYALKAFNKITIRDNKIHFNATVSDIMSVFSMK